MGCRSAASCARPRFSRCIGMAPVLTCLPPSLALARASVDKHLSIMLHVGRVGRVRPGAAVRSLRCRNKAAGLDIEDMDFAVFDDIVPSVQAELPGLYPRSHHGIVHQPFEL